MRGLLLFLCVLLSACQHTSPIQKGQPDQPSQWFSSKQGLVDKYDHQKSLQLWRYTAKVGVSTQSLNEQASLVWRLHDQSNAVSLFGPLGMGAVKIEFDRFGVQVSDSRGVIHRDSSAQELLTRLIGWPLPVEALSFWLFALPEPQSLFEYRLNTEGQVAEIIQLGWQIEFSDYREFDGEAMPRKIIAKKKFMQAELGQVTVRLITKGWRFGVEND